ncbi:MAG: hypothetical protein JW878_09060 [Methanomicrobia archaeon]|nr:hypothetical protein [Methanomicrobia archaeon]
MFEKIIQTISGMSLSDWFHTLGSLIAFALLFLRLIEFRKKRVDLKINLEQDLFTSHQVQDFDTYNETEIRIKVELTNKGLEPTTLNGADFYSDYEELNNLSMSDEKIMHPYGLEFEFNPIRIEGNDRKTVTLTVFKNTLLPEDKKQINAKVILKTTHKDISKKITLKRNDER